MKSLGKARGVERIDLAVAGSLALTYVIALVKSTSNLGYARDEGFYFQASSAYARWFALLWERGAGAFDRAHVDGAWSANHEHPALMKALFGLSNLVLQQRFHLFAMDGTSFRFPAIVVAGALVGLVYLWGAEARGRVCGLAAAVLLAAMPRVFYHAHLACFDVPIAFFWTATAYAYWKAQRALEGAAWPIATGVLFGLALDTKHNAWFLPFALGTHAALVALSARFARPALARDEAKARASRAFGTLALMLALGPLVFYALWPWIWHDTLARLRAYAAFHLNHEYYNMEFFGETYWTPPMPRLYAPVMTLATVPTITLALAAVGLVVATRARLAPVVSHRVGERARAWLGPARAWEPGAAEVLWLVGLGVNYAAWLSPNTPIFGGTKHWMTAYPFLALFAGAGLAAAAASLRRALGGRASALGARLGGFARSGSAQLAALGVLAFAAPIVETAHSHPWGLSAYVPLVGGASGAATLGLNRTFWGYTTGAVVDWLNANAPRGATVYVHDTAAPAWEMLRRDKRLRADIRGVGTVVGADLALYHHEPHMEGQEYQAWGIYGTDQPAYVAGLDGVPVIWIYGRGGRSDAIRAR